MKILLLKIQNEEKMKNKKLFGAIDNMNDLYLI